MAAFAQQAVLPTIAFPHSLPRQEYSNPLRSRNQSKEQRLREAPQKNIMAPLQRFLSFSQTPLCASKQNQVCKNEFAEVHSTSIQAKVRYRKQVRVLQHT